MTTAILKNRQTAISLQWLDRTAWNLARWRLLASGWYGVHTLRRPICVTVKISYFKNSKMTDGRRVEKSKTTISPQRFDRSARHLAWWRIWVLRRVRQLKFWTLKNPTWRMAAILKQRQTAIKNYLGNNLTDWREICMVSHIGPPNRTGS